MEVLSVKPTTRHVTHFLVVLPLLASAWGCTSLARTKPNIPYQGTRPEPVKKIKLANPLLATELLKLPEMQDGVSAEEAIALETIAELYDNSPAVFDKAFDQMYEVGLPGVRRYCSPLQALFWLAKDNELTDDNNVLVEYSLESLLAKAWKFDPLNYCHISEKEIGEIIDNVLNDYIQKQYLDDLRGGAICIQIQASLVADYRRSRRTGAEVFSKKAAKIIKNKIVEARAPQRWEDFDVVVERLNAPKLIDYYEKRRFRYVHWSSLPSSLKRPHSANPYYVFKYNKGECQSITEFTVLCLRRGGYKAWKHKGKSVSGVTPFHVLCVFEMDGKKYCLDNGRPVPRGIIPWDLYRYK
jgi:hypothetical protein